VIKITRTTRISKHNRHFIFLKTLINAAVITTIRLRFDGRSTAYRTLLRSRWRNASAAADPLTVVTLTYLFIYLGLSTAATHSQAYDRNVGRQIVVVGSNGRSGGSKSVRSRIVVAFAVLLRRKTTTYTALAPLRSKLSAAFVTPVHRRTARPSWPE